jgi:hypothetical protein
MLGDRADIHARIRQVRQKHPAERVAPDRSDHGDRRPVTGGGHGLVAAFAAAFESP